MRRKSPSVSLFGLTRSLTVLLCLFGVSLSALPAHGFVSQRTSKTSVPIEEDETSEKEQEEKEEVLLVVCARQRAPHSFFGRRLQDPELQRVSRMCRKHRLRALVGHRISNELCAPLRT